MKKLRVCLYVCLFCFLLLPLAVYAQGNNNPPPCCPRAHGVPGEITLSIQPPTALARLDVSDVLLESQGITRRMLVDRMLQSFFPGRDVDVLVTARTVLEPTIQTPTTSGRIQGRRFLLIQETMTYRVSLLDLTSEEIDALDDFVLTDGNASIAIRFAKQDLPAATARN